MIDDYLSPSIHTVNVLESLKFHLLDHVVPKARGLHTYCINNGTALFVPNKSIHKFDILVIALNNHPTLWSLISTF